MRHREVPQTRRTGGDRDGQIQSEEALAALWFRADDADGLFGPQPGDQPALGSRLMAQASGLSQTAVVRIWHAFGLQPHRTETYASCPSGERA